MVYYVKSVIQEYQLLKKLFNRVILSQLDVFVNISLTNPKQKKNGREKTCYPNCRKSPPSVWS